MNLIQIPLQYKKYIIQRILEWWLFFWTVYQEFN